MDAGSSRHAVASPTNPAPDDDDDDDGNNDDDVVVVNRNRHATTTMRSVSPALVGEMEALERMLTDGDMFRAPTPPPPEWDAAMSRATEEAGAVERSGRALRLRVSSARQRVENLRGSSDILREIEEMTAELGARTASFGRELEEVAKLNDVKLLWWARRTFC